MGTGFCLLYCEIHYIWVHYIKVWVYKKITISFFLRTAWCTSWITYPRWQPNLQGTRWTLKIWPFVLLQCSWWILVRVSPLHRTFQSLFKFSNTWLKSGPKTKSQCYRLLKYKKKKQHRESCMFMKRKKKEKPKTQNCPF